VGADHHEMEIAFRLLAWAGVIAVAAVAIAYAFGALLGS
jgi:hypothetical protein